MGLEPPSLDFIAGLIVGEGCFTTIKQGSQEVHAFQLKMHADERPLFELIINKLDLKEKIHEYTHQERHYVLLLIRSKEVLIKKIVPAFDGRLYGIKKIQFEKWRSSLVNHILNSKYKRYLIDFL